MRAHLRHWERRAEAIDEPELRTRALDKLHDEGFNAAVAAMVATGTPPAYRNQVVEAIVALEVLFDYLDGLTEAPSGKDLRDGRQLFGALFDAISLDTPPQGDYYRHHAHSESGYLEELIATVRSGLQALPAVVQVSEPLEQCAARCAEAQLRTHAIPRDGASQAERWARSAAEHSWLDWREFLAGSASSVLAMHALIAAAADRRTTRELALEIDAVYLPICVMPSMLDSLVDQEHDAQIGRPGFIRHYEDGGTLELRLDGVAKHVVDTARTVPRGAHHAMILAGILAYYTTNPTADSELAQPVFRRLHRRLRPVITLALITLRAWRLSRRVRRRWNRQREPNTSRSRPSTDVTGS